MTTLHRLPEPGALPALGVLLAAEPHNPLIAFTKGSVDGILDICSQVWIDGAFLPMDSAWQQRIRAANNRLAQKGMRVLGMAFQLRTNDAVDQPGDPLENDLMFIGMIGMIDPARPEVFAAVRTAQTAGIRPIDDHRRPPAHRAVHCARSGYRRE